MSEQSAIGVVTPVAEPSRRRRWFAVAAAAALTVLAGTTWALTAPTAHVAVPGRNASPEQVVRAYLDASNVHDVATMNALTAGSGMVPESRFRPTWLVSRVRTYPPRPDGGPGSAWTGWHQVVNVSVDMFVLKGHDLNFPDHTPATWGYILARQSGRDPWRIIDQGVG